MEIRSWKGPRSRTVGWPVKVGVQGMGKSQGGERAKKKKKRVQRMPSEEGSMIVSSYGGSSQVTRVAGPSWW